MIALDWLATRQQAVHSVEPLAGLTGCSRLITLESGQKLVWREQSRQASDYGVNYQLEAKLLSALDFLPFTPKPYHIAPEFTLLHWIEGDTPTEYDTPLLQQLAEQLAELHAIDLQAVQSSPDFAKLVLHERCQVLWDTLSPEQQAILPFSPPFQAVEPFATAICHHDLHLGNLVLQGEQLFLIDWEYSAISDPALELALFFSANTLTEDQQAVFLATYFAKSAWDRTACLAKVAEYQPLVKQLTALWFALHDNVN